MIIYFDTETTGLRPGQICQLSYIMQNDGGSVAKNMYFCVDDMEQSAYAVHGLSLEKLRELSDGAKFSDRIEEIEEDFSKADMTVSHNVAFDFMFMRAEFERAGRIFMFKNQFCTMKNMTPVCKLPRRTGEGYKYPKLSELCGYFSLAENDIVSAGKKLFGDVYGAHDARFDTSAVYLAVNEGIRAESAMRALKEYL